MKIIDSIQEALAIYDTAKEGSVEYLSALYYLLERMPPALKEKLSSQIAASFPDIKPVGYDDQGNPCYNLDDIVKHLGLNEEDVNKVIALREDLPGMFVPPGTVIHKMQ